MKLKAYISGPMTGMPAYNFPAFYSAAKVLRKKGFIPLNPADNRPKPKAPAYGDYIRMALTKLAKADLLVVLPGWRKSRGAELEVSIARLIGIPVKNLALEPIKETICEEADRIVSDDRQGAYGHPIDDFTRTGRIWGAILQKWALETEGNLPVPPEIVGLCMVAIKISREVHRHKRDNLVDGCGYFKTVDLVQALACQKNILFK